MTWLYPKLRRIGLVYGDSGIFVRREIYEGIGGFKPFPLFEDLDFVRRLRREGRFVNLSASVRTSSRRFERRSFLLMFSRWSFLQILFWLGVSPYFLARFYRPVRDSKKWIEIVFHSNKARCEGTHRNLPETSVLRDLAVTMNAAKSRLTGN